MNEFKMKLKNEIDVSIEQMEGMTRKRLCSMLIIGPAQLSDVNIGTTKLNRMATILRNNNLRHLFLRWKVLEYETELSLKVGL